MNFPLYSLRDCISSFAPAHIKLLWGWCVSFPVSAGGARRERKVRARAICLRAAGPGHDTGQLAKRARGVTKTDRPRYIRAQSGGGGIPLAMMTTDHTSLGTPYNMPHRQTRNNKRRAGIA